MRAPETLQWFMFGVGAGRPGRGLDHPSSITQCALKQHRFLQVLVAITARSYLPIAANRERVTRLTTEWKDVASTLPDDIAVVLATPASEALLERVFSASPFLSELVLKHPSTFYAFVAHGPASALQSIEVQLGETPNSNVRDAMTLLREAKQKAAFIIALADITEQWIVDQVTAALSRFADMCVQRAVATLLLQASERGHIKVGDPSRPENECGYAVLGLGKLGGNELNYSSDIDLFVVFDEHSLNYVGNASAKEWAVHLTRDLVRMLQERTADGYVFRTDLRLRPDPGSTAVAVSREAAQIYYESHGQNWERAAMIKARPTAGDLKLGASFIRDLQAFIWRKSLDFYTIQDIHSIKRQIYAHKGGGTVVVPGHNIKLGRGGIREIEFFVQIQQLIWGGRFPEARTSQTLPGLAVLCELGFTTQEVRDDLTAAYRYLRTLEHRLQMVGDQQTQTLPDDESGLAEIAAFMGCADLPTFVAEVEQVLRTVETHYAGLFEDAPSLAVDGNLVFTGTEDDPDTIATLRRLGYQDATMVAQTVRGWHHGRFRATRSDRARQLLTEVMPTLLSAFAKTTQPDQALIRFDRSLAALPAGVPLLSVFYANPELLDLVAEIMGDAPRLAEHVTRNPGLFDYVLEPAFYRPIGNLAELREDLDAVLRTVESFEDSLDVCRRWAHDQQFRIGVHALRAMITPVTAAAQLTDVAETVIGGLVPRVCDDFARTFGHVPGGELLVLAYGKLASHELTPTSDLDLVLIYDAHEDALSTGGPKSFPATAYYIRLAQRIISAFTVMTREGTLYAVDMRLRPNGEKGPLACSFEAFAKYQAQDAWTWEHMALTRTRVVFGPHALADRVNTAITEVLARPRDEQRLVVAVADMRKLMRGEQTDDGLWDLKRHPGGLIDAEFIWQYLLLKYPAARPKELRPATIVAHLAKAKALPQADGDDLLRAIELWANLQFMVRELAEGELPDDTTPLGLKRKLAAIANMPDFATLEDLMRETFARISTMFDEIVARPADDARKALGSGAVVR